MKDSGFIDHNQEFFDKQTSEGYELSGDNTK